VSGALVHSNVAPGAAHVNRPPVPVLPAFPVLPAEPPLPA